MTTEEKQEIINAVLSAIRTNSKTITQLSPVTEMSGDDYIELSGGRRVSYIRLYEVLLAAVEAVVQGNIDAMYNAISALGQAVVHYSDVGELVPELSGLKMLALNQSPLVVFKSMGAAYDGVSREVTIGDGEAKYGGTGSNFQYNRRGNIGNYPVVTYKVYFNSYTGRLYKWTGSSFELVGGGGIDSGIYEVIKSNVNLVATKLDSLISAMAMLAFSGTVNKNALKVGSLSWVEPEIHTPRIITPIDGSTLEFGNATDDDVDIRIGLFVEGADLTKGLTLSITEGSSRFRLESGSSSISKDDANNGTTIYLIYNSSSSVANATGKLNIHSNNEIDVNVNLHGTYSEQGGGDEPVQDPTISVSPSSLSFNAEVGQSAQQTFTVSGSNLTGNIQLSSNSNLFTYEVISGQLTPSNGSVNATVRVTYTPSAPTASGTDSGTITASSTGAISKTVSLSGTATAAASTVNVVYKLLNMSQPSGTTQDQVWGYYKETVDKSTNLSKTLSAINNATLRGDLTVKSGGVVLYKQGGSNNNSGITFSNGTLSITSTVLNSLTDDLIIEATAYTGTVTINASESGVTATIGGATITCSTSNGDGTYSGSASGITSISSLSFASGVKTKITSIDFGGAQFTGTTLADMFSGFTALTQVKGLVVTGSVTSLASMFSGCSALTVFDTIGWDTSAVETIDAFAYDCTVLTKVDLGSKDMGALTTAGSSDSTGAFGGHYTPSGGGCLALATLDVSYWNAPYLTSLRAFLFKASSLTKFDASTWNAPNVANMWGMFASCSSITEIDISGISTANANTQGSGVVQIGHMFDGCTNLTSLKIGLFDTGNVSSVEAVLYNASNTIALYCTSSVVPSINTNETFSLYGTDYYKVWFGNNGSYSNFKYKISEVHVPSGKATDYYNAWAHVDLGGGSYANYIGLTEDKFIDDL